MVWVSQLTTTLATSRKKRSHKSVLNLPKTLPNLLILNFKKKQSYKLIKYCNKSLKYVLKI